MNSTPWAIKLFNKSPLKQEKYKQITALLGDATGLKCLDIGSDNGVISYLLRERGGQWSSADLVEETVESIKSLVEDNVYKIDGLTIPFKDNEFDCVVIVDFLEHIETDKEFLRELNRIIKPGGRLIVNVPNPKEGLLRKVRFAIGQTDEAHGHLRAGYSVDTLRTIMPEAFELRSHSSYSKLFSVLIDTAITFALELVANKKQSKKGTVVTKDDINKQKKLFKLYSLIYPIIALFVSLDKLIPFGHGNMEISLWIKSTLK